MDGEKEETEKKEEAPKVSINADTEKLLEPK